MLSRFLAAAALASAVVLAQTAPPIEIEVRTESAQCDAIAPRTACLRYTQPPFPETVGAKTPEFAGIRVSGPEGTPAVIQAVVISPGDRQWLRLRKAGAPVGTGAIADQLPQDVEIYVDEPEALQMRAGRFLGMLLVTVTGSEVPLKLPVQLSIGPETDVITATPDFLPEITVTASGNPEPQRFELSVGRNGVGPPIQVTVTPQTSDGGSWLTSDLDGGLAFKPCSTEPVPCEFEAIVTPPSTKGDYWGALVISGDGYADRVAVRVKVESSIAEDPPIISPSQVSLSAPVGSTAAVSALVELKGRYSDIPFRTVMTDPWLSVDPASARWPAVIKVIANPTGLEPGLYSDVVQIQAVGTNEVLGSISVNFTITAPIFLPTLFDGGGWRSTVYLVNPGTKDVKANLRFWSSPREAGEPWLLGLEGRGLTTKVEDVIVPPLGLRVIETQGTQSNRQQGWAELTADGAVAAHVMLSEAKTTSASRAVPVEATIPLVNAFRDRLLAPYDNLGEAVASLSLANPEDEPVTIGVRVLNENGAEISNEGKITLTDRGAATFVVATKWPSTAKRRGVIALEFDGHRLLAIGGRAFGFGFHAFPAVARGEPGADRGIPRVTAGGGWQSTAYLPNSSAIPQSGVLRLWPDASRGPGAGLSEELALSSPANGMLVWQAAAPAGTLAESGWLESRYPKQVGGFLLLQQMLQTPAGPVKYESAFGGEVGFNGRIAIPFDYRGSNSTLIVLINTNDEPTDIQTAIYDPTGRFPRFGETFRLAGRGQMVVNGAERWELGGQQGVISFASRQSFRLSGGGLRFGDGPVVVLPAFDK